MLDMSRLRSVYVDPLTCTATVGVGCRAGDIDRETALHNLLLPLGFAPTTGMALVFGGGVGLASRQFGLPMDCLESVTLVTAQGRVVQASAEQHPELFWGLHGYGANLGVITHLTLRLHPGNYGR